jgi:peptidoglycan/xylan/chitin deacetylase (PgdA/CDA1 family)
MPRRRGTGPIRHASRAVHAAALTFDDGPGPHTDRTLDALRAHGATATFFVVGSRLAPHGAAVERIVAEGHELGSHSWDHARPGRNHLRSWVDLVRTSRAIARAAGARPRWFRPPYAAWSPGLGAAAALAGMRTVTWDVDPRDWETADAALVARRVGDSTLPGSIILLHETAGGVAVEALGEIVEALHSRGLATVTVTELLARG